MKTDSKVECVKCREYYQQRGEPVPNGTPTVEAMKKEDMKRKGRME